MIPRRRKRRPKVRHVFKAELNRVVDADTYELILDRSFDDRSLKSFRLYSCNAPEQRGVERVAGEYVTAQVKKMLGDRRSFVVDSKQYEMSFTRIMAWLWVDEETELSQWLLDNRLAWPTDENGKIIGPRDIELLNLPPGVKQAVREAMQ